METLMVVIAAAVSAISFFVVAGIMLMRFRRSLRSVGSGNGTVQRVASSAEPVFHSDMRLASTAVTDHHGA